MSVTRDRQAEFLTSQKRQIPPGAHCFDGIAPPPCGDDVSRKWLQIAEWVGTTVDLERSANAQTAMPSRIGVLTATRLLCLALLYGPGRMSPRLIVERAQQNDIAVINEPTLLRHLETAAPWLIHVADTLIANELQRLAAPSIFSHRTGAVRAERHLRARQIRHGRAFILDFVPWPVEAFCEQQTLWLLGARWNYVAATLKDGSRRRSPETQPAGPLERTYHLAQLIAAVL